MPKLHALYLKDVINHILPVKYFYSLDQPEAPKVGAMICTCFAFGNGGIKSDLKQ